MDAKRVCALVVLGIYQLLTMMFDKLDEATHQQRQQRAEYLKQMTQLLEELEQMSQEQMSEEQFSVDGEALVFAALPQWQYWSVAAVLVLLFQLCWGLWKWMRDQEEDEEGEELLQMYRFLKKRPSWPVANRPGGTCLLMEELVNDLLCVCQNLSSNSFTPRLQPAVILGRFAEGRSPLEEVVYRLLVPLKPPPGHSFHLERGSRGEKLVRDTRLRVKLECTCIRERRLGDMLCFLHHPEEELMISQEASLLQTLCTGSYLDVQKTALWLQQLMTAASVILLEEAPCKVVLLPSTQFCKFKLTNSTKTLLYVELILAVQEGNDLVSME